MGDAIEVGFLIAVGVVGSWSTRCQVAELSRQRQGECLYDDEGRSGDQNAVSPWEGWLVGAN